ncbi:DNA translocase FtsK [Caldinitratiruptor microaerophilus]|uniref:FtsK domain-containing protein n=1 Tax=Caldinitratiruptor microaerophilus TaxID=671077 RepID=A0AA35CI83_9FIRM|nr:DNA translocase FtsK [Caldinitratiruptor microaerophilus]BDG59437.1 hypothetical protein caldi_05270 [Caldinitratiruptor microaerophilus]
MASGTAGGSTEFRTRRGAGRPSGSRGGAGEAVSARRAGRDGDRLEREVAGVVLGAVAVWLYLSLAGGGGLLGGYTAAGLRAVVGQTVAWGMPGLLAVLGGYTLYRRGEPGSVRPAWGLALILIVLTAGVQVWQFPDAGTRASPSFSVTDWLSEGQGRGGGVVGYVLAYGATRLLGTAGRWALLAAGFLVGLLLTFPLSLGDVITGTWHGARRIGSTAAAGAGRLVVRHRARAAPPRPSGLRPDAVATVANAGAAARVGGSGAGAAAVLGPARDVEGGPGGRTRRRGRGGPAGSDLPGAADAAGPARQGPAGTATGAEGPVIRFPTGASPGAETTAGLPGGDTSGAGPVGATPPPGEAPGAPVSRPPEAERQKALPVRITRQGDAWQLALRTDAPGEYRLPGLDLLRRGQTAAADSHRAILDRARLLEETLASYGVPAKVVEVHPGPTITRFELTVEPGVRISKVASLADDLAYNLAARDIRIEAPIPGKRAIGIEVPNAEVVTVHLRDVLESPEFQQSASRLVVGFGKDIAGKPVVGDLERMPHLLIAGATGSGKSVCMNGIICSLLMRARPDEVKMLMIDPKRVELSVYDGIPHLVAPVCTDARKAAGYLKWAVKEMERRYDLLASSGTRNITGYNRWVREQREKGAAAGGEPPPEPLPYIVIFIDELSDLMMVAPVEVEDAIIRLAQMARACGIHLVVATQRPSVDVITGLIKANIPSRIAFAVSSQVDSRTILDQAGAERLLGKGDMLYHPQGVSRPIRAQGAYVSDREVEALVAYVKSQGQPVYQAEAMEVEGTGRARPAAEAEREKESAVEAIFPQAVRVVIEHGQASVSILQRRLRCNYTKAVRLIDMMEERGFIGPHQGPKPRDVLISMAQWEALFGAREQSAASAERPEAGK